MEERWNAKTHLFFFSKNSSMKKQNFSRSYIRLNWDFRKKNPRKIQKEKQVEIGVNCDKRAEKLENGTTQRGETEL